MLIEFHMLKNYPPTNLNRDETGSPKTAFFGGSLRGRISSQCLKHSWRISNAFKSLDLGIRTRCLPELVAEVLLERGISIEYVEAAKKKITGFGNKDSKETDDFQTKQIMFFSQSDISAVADEVEKSILETNNIKEFDKITATQWKKKLKSLVRPSTIDIALFGRMITDEAFADVEASMQVAHAISTNAVNQESDFFTAVDDLCNEYRDDSGSAMMGDIDYNSCCYYIYVALDVGQLTDNLQNTPEMKDILEKLMPVLLETLTFSNPSGKQNSFAGHIIPSLICVERKDRKIPVSYVNAFEKPIRNDYVSKSITSLVNEINNFDHMYGKIATERLWFCCNNKINELPVESVNVATFNELAAKCSEWLKEV